MLLNEVQKQQRRADAKDKEIADLKKRLAELEAKDKERDVREKDRDARLLKLEQFVPAPPKSDGGNVVLKADGASGKE
jgi:hypothetical protein